MSLFGRFKPAGAAIRRGDALAADGDFPAAIEQYSIAIGHDPTSERAFTSRASIYRQLEDYPSALMDYDEALRLNAKSAPAYYHRGLTHVSLGDYEAAIEDMSSALDAGLREKYLAFGTRGTALFALGNIDEAHADYMRAETVLVGWVYARAGLAICHHALGEIDAARELWGGLIARDERYHDLDWAQTQFSWPEPLLMQAEALITAIG
jgi:tetratricopeptide (TPR) repeat protein